MILSYREKRTADFARGKRVKAFSGIERPARLKLRICFEWPEKSLGPQNVEIVGYH
jgi:antitoxin HigA-1